MNITETKNKRTNLYRSNATHGGDQQGYNRSPRQDNNVITFKQKSNSHLASINCRTSSTETIVIPETQDNGGMNSFLVNSSSR